MNLKELKEIIDLVTSRESIEELEIEKSGVRLRIKRASNHINPTISAAHHVSAAVSVAPASPPIPVQAPVEADDLFYIKSPIVGTFYRAPSPTSDPYINVGDSVDKGTVLCVIEAMKLMNEIESEAAGEVVTVFAENGQPVEYGERLFAIRPR